MATINERFFLILNTFFKRNVSEMARQTGIPQPTLNNIVANKLNKPSADSLEKLINTMENINAEWLLTGKGEMLKKQEQNNEINNSKNFAIQQGENNTYNNNEYIERIIDINQEYIKRIDKIIELLTNKK